MKKNYFYRCFECIHFLSNAKRCAINAAPHPWVDATTDASKCVELGMFKERK